MAADDAPTTRARAEIVDEICGRIAAGESVAAVFRAPGADFPDITTFWRWLHADAALTAAYDRATESRSEKYAEDIAEIADERPPLEQTQFGQRHDSAFVAWQKNRIEARKWIAARMRPKRWGDRTIVAGDADNPLRIVDDRAIASKLLPEIATAAAPATPGEPDA